MSKLGGIVRDRRAVRAAQLVIGLVFIVAALAKIGDMRTFASQIHNFRLVPVWSENLIAMILPWIELIAGLCLIVGTRARAGGLLTAAMMAAFTVAVAQAFARGLDIECGCFGTADASTVGLKKLGENVVLTAIAVMATLRPR